MILDALGNEIIVGNWYGYSRNDGGFSHTTIGKASKVIEGNPNNYDVSKVRLTDCKVEHRLYGVLSDHRAHKKPADVTIASYMVFPVPSQD